MPFKKGDSPWNSGLTKENDEGVRKNGKNVGEALTGRVLSVEHKKHIRDGLVGHICSEETKEKIREAEIGEKNHMYGKKIEYEYGKREVDGKKQER